MSCWTGNMQTHASLLAHVLMLAGLSAMGRWAVIATPECYVLLVVCGVAVPSLSLSLTAPSSVCYTHGLTRDQIVMHQSMV